MHGGAIRCVTALQVRLSALQEANDALTSDAARVPERANRPSALSRSIQDAMAMLQESPILREHNRSNTNIRRLSPSGSDWLPTQTRGTRILHHVLASDIVSAQRVPET